MNKLLTALACCLINSISQATTVIDVTTSTYHANDIINDDIEYNILVSGDVFFSGTIKTDHSISFTDKADRDSMIYLTPALSISGDYQVGPQIVSSVNVGKVVVQTPIETTNTAVGFSFDAKGDVIIESSLKAIGGIYLSSLDAGTIISTGAAIETANIFQVNGTKAFELRSGVNFQARSTAILGNNQLQGSYAKFESPMTLTAGDAYIDFGYFPVAGNISVFQPITANNITLRGKILDIYSDLNADLSYGKVSLSSGPTGQDGLTSLFSQASVNSNTLCFSGDYQILGASINATLSCN